MKYVVLDIRTVERSNEVSLLSPDRVVVAGLSPSFNVNTVLQQNQISREQQ